MGNYVVPSAITWTVTGEAGSPDLRMEFEVRNGRPECTEFHIVGAPDGRPVRTSDVTGFNIDAFAREVFMEFADAVVEDAGGSLSTETRSLTEREVWEVRKAVEDAQALPQGPSDAELRAVVDTYRRNPDAPMRNVELRHGYSRRTAYRRVAEARERGLFDESGSGENATTADPTQDEIREALRRRGHKMPGDTNG